MSPDAPLVLVVDDNPDMNAFETEMLRQKYRVETAFDGEQGLEKALKLVPDLILSDEMMPRMSGSRMVQALRRHRELDDTPILLATARADEAFLVDMLKKGAQGYFIKPFSAEELIAKVDGLIAEKKSKQELRKAVEERTRELIQSQELFLHAEKLAEIGRLSASIAHEFNNPLQSVTTVLRGIGRHALQQDDKKLLDLALQECRRMKKLIVDLQNFYRPTSDRIESVNLHEVFDSLLLMAKRSLKTKKISVFKEYSRDLPTIKGVQDQLMQVILNLFSNAADACEDGGVITVSTEVIDSDKVAFHIRDNGGGIDPAAIDQIFEPFFTTKRHRNGSGLGLYVSYGIVRKHGGYIKVKSQRGKGTVFSVILPVQGTGKL